MIYLLKRIIKKKLIKKTKNLGTHEKKKIKKLKNKKIN